MKHESFEHLDERWMKIMKTVRQRKMNPDILKGFSASVERRLGTPVLVKPRRKFLLPVAAPVFAVLILAAVMTTHPRSTPVTGVSGLAEEVTALRNIGAWTDEDDQTILPASEINFDLESLA